MQAPARLYACPISNARLPAIVRFRPIRKKRCKLDEQQQKIDGLATASSCLQVSDNRTLLIRSGLDYLGGVDSSRVL